MSEGVLLYCEYLHSLCYFWLLNLFYKSYYMYSMSDGILLSLFNFFLSKFLSKSWILSRLYYEYLHSLCYWMCNLLRS